MGHDLLANLLGAWSEELSLGAILLRVALSALFTAVIGCERSSKRHSAGLRTFILVSIAGVSVMLIDQWLMAFSGVKLPDVCDHALRPYLAEHVGADFVLAVCGARHLRRPLRIRTIGEDELLETFRDAI